MHLGSFPVEEGQSAQLSDNVVKIRIWGTDLISHVSLETKNIYVSLWPNTSDGEKAASLRAAAHIGCNGFVGSFCRVPQTHIPPENYAVSAVPAKLHSLQHDQNQIYHAPPDRIFQLELPTTSEMELSFLIKLETIFRAHKISWDLFGYGQSSSAGRYFNCATLVYNLLTIGGIYEVMNTPPISDRRIPAWLGFISAIVGLILLLTNHDKKQSINIASICLLTVGLVTFFGLVTCGIYLKCRNQTRDIRETFITSPGDIAKMMKLAKADEITDDSSIMSTQFIDYLSHGNNLTLSYVCSLVKKFVNILLKLAVGEFQSDRFAADSRTSLAIIADMERHNNYYIADTIRFNKFIAPILGFHNLIESMPDLAMSDYRIRFGTAASVNAKRIHAVIDFKKKIYQGFLHGGIFDILIHRYPFLRNKISEILMPNESPLLEGQAIMMDINSVARNSVINLLMVVLLNETRKFQINSSLPRSIESSADGENSSLLS